MLAVVCPGQGAQTPGFLRPWLDLRGVEAQLAALSQAGGLDLARHGTRSDADTIRDTGVAQPLIVAAGVVGLVALTGATAVDPARVGVVGGHSVGEVTATIATGVLEPEVGMRLVAARGRAMAEAASSSPTGMSAILGGDEQEVAAALTRHGLVAANVNGAGQVVAAGDRAALAALADDAPSRARVIPLEVAGAFHTEVMRPAVHVLAEHTAALAPRPPVTRLVSNADGALVENGADVLARLVRQVAAPVRWDRCMETLVELGVTGLLELPPAGTLVGLARRAMRGVETVALRSPDDLDAARALIAAHAGPARTPAAGDAA